MKFWFNYLFGHFYVSFGSNLCYLVTWQCYILVHTTNFYYLSSLVPHMRILRPDVPKILFFTLHLHLLALPRRVELWEEEQDEEEVWRRRKDTLCTSCFNINMQLKLVINIVKFKWPNNTSMNKIITSWNISNHLTT